MARDHRSPFHVVVFQRYLTHYRVPLFERLSAALACRGIRLSLVAGSPDEVSDRKKDSAVLAGATMVKPIQFEIGVFMGIWLPMPRSLGYPDLVILPQESKLLANYVWLARRLVGGPRVAYWGHGTNFQSDSPRGWRERWKRFLITRVDWWFAYTSRTRAVLLDAGYPETKITVLDNAIDNATFRSELDAVTPDDLDALRRKVGAGETAPVGLFCGSLYPDKRLDYLIAAGDMIHESLPDFRLVIIGDGPARDELVRRIDGRSWIHATGALQGAEKARWFRIASVMLNPGLVGLNILDAFCAGLPLITTREARHSPEIAYLEDGHNGLMLEGDPAAYAAAVIDLFRNRGRLAEVSRQAAASAQRHTLAAMVDNFVGGIESCRERGLP